MNFRELLGGIYPPCSSCLHTMYYMPDGKPTCMNCMAHLILNLYRTPNHMMGGSRPSLVIQDEVT